MWDKYPEIALELDLVEKYIKKNAYSRNGLLSEIAEDLISSGGKRIRPALVILSSKFGRYDRDTVIPSAGAVEVLHTATLVHDDIIDRAHLRRGRPTVAQKYGNDMAVYTGDYLFSKAMLMLSCNMQKEHLEKIARAVKVICEGEVDQFLDRFKPETSVYSYLKKSCRKTAVLFGAACAIGGGIAECPNQTVRALTKFGISYGMAFQIKDDLNDYVSSAREEGKPVVNDIMKGIITLPLIYAFQKSRALTESIRRAMGHGRDLSAEEAAEIAEMVIGAGGIEASRRLLERYIDKGRGHIESLPESEARTILGDLILRLN